MLKHTEKSLVHRERKREPGCGSRELGTCGQDDDTIAGVWEEQCVVGGRRRDATQRVQGVGGRQKDAGGPVGEQDDAGRGHGAGEATVVRRATSEMPTRQTLKRGIRVSEAMVARMDTGVATKLGERRARLRQQEAEASWQGS